MKLARIERDGEWLAEVRDGRAHLLQPWSEWTWGGVPSRSPDGSCDLADARLLPPVDAGTKIICLGLNYQEHAEEAGGEVADNPALFTKFPDALVGGGDELLRPPESPAFDFEGEIAVVIGRGGRRIERRDALAHVFGYTIMLDGSVRDYQAHSIAAGKNFWRSGALGPWIVTADEMPDPAELTLETRLNGAVVQSGAARCMIHDIPSAIAYISRWTPLAPGDVIATGTPAGVGAMRQPPLWMKAGDVIEVHVPAIGTLLNKVRDESVA